MKLLAFDTSTTTASVAMVDDGRCLAQLTDSSGDHSDKLLGLIDSCMEQSGHGFSDIDGIAVGAGPGSFTGLRIGLATAKGIALARNLPLYVVSSLAALAAGAQPGPDIEHIAAIVNAHRKEVFLGLFDATSRELIGEEHVLRPQDVAAALADAGAQPHRTLLVGEGPAMYAEALEGVGLIAGAGPLVPPAVGIAVVASRHPQLDQLVHSTPSYIRPAEAEVRFPRGNPGGTFAPAAKKVDGDE